MDVKNFIQKIVEHLIQATFSNPREKIAEEASRIVVRPISVQGQTLYQLSEQIQNRVIHSNLKKSDWLRLIFEQHLGRFKQALFQTAEGDYQLLTNKRGETTILSHNASKKGVSLSHNRVKQYILPEGQAIPFLVELGLMSSQGRVFPKKMDKFRQINRFVEMIADCLPEFDTKEKLHVVDFGCGKAYLTFALYYFLREIKKLDVHVTGLDLKADVIAFCQQLANKLQYERLQFAVADIAHYDPSEKVGMVIALHACDRATDAALAKAIGWRVQVILAAPCCQHELFEQVQSKQLGAILQHGILKERFAALATDAARASLLEREGYATQILEFIDSEHTPKNLLLRARRGNSLKQREEAAKRFQELKSSLEISPALEQMLERSI